MSSELIRQDYLDFLGHIKGRIRQRQYQALRAVNNELVMLYWELGEAIEKKQLEQGWGKSVVENLARDLQGEFPGRNGFSARNLWNMLEFYRTYSHLQKLQPLVAEISWAKNIVIHLCHSCLKAITLICQALNRSQYVCRLGVVRGWEMKKMMIGGGWGMSSDKHKSLILPIFLDTIKHDWSWERLDNISEVYDCPHSTPQLVNDITAPLIVRSQDVRTGTFLLEKAAKVSIDTYKERIKRVEPRFGDLVYSREGTYFGIAAEVPRNVKVCLGQRMVLIRPDSSRINHSFLKYWLNSPQMFGHIHGFRDGTVAERLNLPVIRGLAIAYPSLSEQKQIASFLSAIDDRIALLRETNKTLEAIAQAIFKSWFVDFDPVRAKQEGREPEGMDADTAALFPDSFEDSELGLIPKGWRVGILQDLLILQRGFDLPTSDRVPGKFPIIAASGPSGTHNISMAKGPGVITGRSGILGRVFLELDDYWPLNTALWIKEFRVASPCYAYELLRLLDFASFNAGSAVPTLNRNHVHSLKYLIPTTKCIDEYEKIAIKLHQRVKANQQQAQSLTQIRDTLLPRLISGQLRLPDAESIVKEATA